MSKENKPIDLSDPTIEKVIEALKRGNKVEAIIQYRSTHKVLLAEALEEVEKIAEQLGV
jgi:hypothetical protein